MFTFAHLSDPHFTSLHDVSWKSLLNKRAMGYLSWYLHRQSEHRPEVLDSLVHDLAQRKPDHVVITGDLTHLGLPEEFHQARLWLDSLQKLADVTVIPGNHEAYISTSFESTLQQWEPYLISQPPLGNGQTTTSPSQIFPSLRIHGPIAFIGLSSACPTPPFFATGAIDEAQLETLSDLLRSSRIQELFRVLLVHHPPIPQSVRWRKRLTNAKRLAQLLFHHPVDLILHGHTHRSSLHDLPTTMGSTPIIGVPSASAIGTNPGQEAQYCLFEAQGEPGDYRISASVHAFSSKTHQFTFSHHLPLNR